MKSAADVKKKLQTNKTQIEQYVKSWANAATTFTGKGIIPNTGMLQSGWLFVKYYSFGFNHDSGRRFLAQ